MPSAFGRYVDSVPCGCSPNVHAPQGTLIRLDSFVCGRLSSFDHFLARGMSLSPQEKRMRMIRQVVIFGIVLPAFLDFTVYRLKTGNFG